MPRQKPSPLAEFNRDMALLSQTMSRSIGNLSNPFISKARPNIDEINFHFFNLKKIASKYAPHKLPKVEQLHRLLIHHAKGHISDSNALEEIAQILRQEGLGTHPVDFARMTMNSKFPNFSRPNPLLRNMNPFATMPKVRLPRMADFKLPRPQRIEPLKLVKPMKRNPVKIRLPRLRLR